VALVRLESRRGPGLTIALGFLAVVAVAGILGRLVPAPQPAQLALPDGSATNADPSSAPRLRVASPIAGVTWLRTTEVRVHGVADAGLGQLDVLLAPAAPGPAVSEYGRTSMEVDAGGAFDAVVSFVPPFERTMAVLEISPRDAPDVVLAELTFPVEAGSLLLVRDPARLRGRPGGVLVVDVLAYEGVPRVRALLTGRDGILIASVERVLSRAGAATKPEGDQPRTIALEIPIPATGVPDRGRLHLLGFDREGMEIEHIDATVSLGR
jgi:hypothetical protein